MTKRNRVVEAMEAHWGERCAENEPGCPCCDAWAQYDAMKAERDRMMNPPKPQYACQRCGFSTPCMSEDCGHPFRGTRARDEA